MTQANSTRGAWKQRLKHEIVEYVIIVVYLAAFFAVFLTYRRLILAEYSIAYDQYGVALIKALVLGKVVLIAEKLRLSRWLDGKPLIFPILYKSLLFTIFSAVFTILEGMVRGLIHSGNAQGALQAFKGEFNDEALAGAVVVFAVFIPFFAVRELRGLLGDGAITRLLLHGSADFEAPVARD